MCATDSTTVSGHGVFDEVQALERREAEAVIASVWLFLGRPIRARITGKGSDSEPKHAATNLSGRCSRIVQRNPVLARELLGRIRLILIDCTTRDPFDAVKVDGSELRFSKSRFSEADVEQVLASAIGEEVFRKLRRNQLCYRQFAINSPWGELEQEKDYGRIYYLISCGFEGRLDAYLLEFQNRNATKAEQRIGAVQYAVLHPERR